MIGRESMLIVWRVVLQHGGEPECCHTQLFEVVQMFANTIQVATMTQRGFRAILFIRAHTFYLRVMPRTLSKAVGHEHVEHIGIGESHALVATHLAILQRVFYLFLVEFQRHCTCLGVAQVHVHQQIVRRIEAYHTVNPYSWIVGSHVLHCGNVIAIHHQLHLRIFQSYKPIGRVDTVNHCLCCTHSCHVGRQSQ